MKLSTSEAKSLVAKLDAASIGAVIPMNIQSFLPELVGETQVILTEREVGKFWQVGLYCWGISVANMAIEVHGDELAVEEL